MNQESPAGPRIGVVSGRYPASRFEAFINHRAYCARHGYSYIWCNWPTGVANRYMNKMEYIRTYYRLFDYIFWIDDDAFFLRLDQGLEAFLPSDPSFISLCASPNVKGLHTYVSSGQFMLRCSDPGRSFIDAVPQVDLEEVRAWWPQELGYFTKGDQDSFTYLLKTDPRFAHYDRYEYEAFNSRVEDVLAGKDVFLLHITGRVRVKRRKYRRVRKYLGRGPSLLPASEEAQWNLEPPLAQRVLRRLRRGIWEPR